MRFEATPQPATLLSRPNRYLVVARLDSAQNNEPSIVRAHCADPGRLRELLLPGARVWVSPAAPTSQSLRQTMWDLRLVEHADTGALVSIDTRLPNRLFREGLAQGFFSEFADVSAVRAEAVAPFPLADGKAPRGKGRAPHSRFDFHLTHEDGRFTWLEVKSASLVVDRVALFPDAVTERGRRHLLELAALRAQGEWTAVVFIVQRSDADAVTAHRGTDPGFADALDAAHAAGVQFLAATARVTCEEVTLDRRIPVLVGAK